jgi:predicted aspartyl protease
MELVRDPDRREETEGNLSGCLRWKRQFPDRLHRARAREPARRADRESLSEDLMSIARCAVTAAFVTVALALSGRAAAAAPAKCTLIRIAEWPVREGSGQPVVDGAINGQKVGILLDTGSARTIVLRSAAVRLGLVRYDTRSSRIVGIGGETAVETTIVDRLEIGDAVRTNWRLLVAGEHDFGEVALILGDDFFYRVDVEFDLAHNMVRLFQAKDCEGVSLAYWASGDIGVVELDAVFEAAPKIELSVAINGRPVKAQLDSGASRSALTKSQAASLGVSPETPGVVQAGCSEGLGRKALESWIGPFESFGIGNELIRNPTIRFADMWKNVTFARTGSRISQALVEPDMLLGVDFLRAHRVLIAHSQRKMYFTYAGGTVFPATVTKACVPSAGPEADGRSVNDGK